MTSAKYFCSVGFQSNGCSQGGVGPDSCSIRGGAMGESQTDKSPDRFSYFLFMKPADQPPPSQHAIDVANEASNACTEFFDYGVSQIKEIQEIADGANTGGLAKCFFAAIRAAAGKEPLGVLCTPPDSGNDLQVNGLQSQLISPTFPSNFVNHRSLFQATCYLLLPAM